MEPPSSSWRQVTFPREIEAFEHKSQVWLDGERWKRLRLVWCKCQDNRTWGRSTGYNQLSWVQCCISLGCGWCGNGKFSTSGAKSWQSITWSGWGSEKRETDLFTRVLVYCISYYKLWERKATILNLPRYSACILWFLAHLGSILKGFSSFTELRREFRIGWRVSIPESWTLNSWLPPVLCSNYVQILSQKLMIYYKW